MSPKTKIKAESRSQTVSVILKAKEGGKDRPHPHLGGGGDYHGGHGIASWPNGRAFTGIASRQVKISTRCMVDGERCVNPFRHPFVT